MNETPDRGGVESLAPVGPGQRLFSLSSYALMMWSALITVQAIVIGQTFLPPYGQLNLVQGFSVMVLACVVIAVFMSLNGGPGLKYGIPFSIQLRSVYGIRGSKFPQVLRLFPGIVWYGVGTWIAALAMDAIIGTVFGFSSDGMQFAYFFAFQAFQTWLAYKGVRIIKWFNVAASGVLVVILGYIMVDVVRRHGVQFDESWNVPGTWGLGFWIAANSVVGVMAAIIANSSDLSRYVEPQQRSLWWGNFLGILPPLFMMVTLGIMATVATDEWDAVKALMAMTPNAWLMLLLLVFILVAQFSTALVANILPVALIFQETLGVTWHRGVLLAGILGSLTFPWVILASSENVVLFISYYTCFFGPIAGCMVADYLLRKRALDVEALYDKSSASAYWFAGGVNWAGVAATVIPAAISMTWTLKISWLVGFPLGFVIYCVLFPALGRRPAT
jgi:NCS1 family nucleobase:cation symporter-1